MTILFFDTETTGFPKYNLAADHPTQPHLVQLAGVLSDDAGKVLAQLSIIVNSDVDIPSEAANVHGITTETARQFGSPVAVALAPFMHFWHIADLVVAHNYAFDAFILKTAISRRWGVCAGNPVRELPSRASFCTMETSKPIINLPATPKMKAAGFPGPKTPNLAEAYRHFTGEEFSNAHDALADTLGCMKVYFAMQGQKQAEAA